MEMERDRLAKIICTCLLAMALVVVSGCSCEDETPTTTDGLSPNTDGSKDGVPPFRDGPPDLLLWEVILDGPQDKLKQPWDSGVDCTQWSNWYCQGQYPNWEAVCPPGPNPQRIIRCTPDWGCTCEVVAISPETWCTYMPTPSGTDVCSAFEKVFNEKGCCKP